MIAAVVQVRGGIPSGGASLSAGTIIASPGDAIVTIAEDVAPSGGTPPYVRNLYRSTDGSKGSELAADVTLPYDDETVTNDTEYFYTLEVDDDDAGTDDTPTVSATPSASAPLLEEDFSEYSSTANMLADPRDIYETSEDAQTAQMVLDESEGYGALTQCMRYDWPDRSGVCTDYTIGRNLVLPEALTEMWLEVVVKFSAVWSTVNAGCGGVSNPDYKFIFGRVNGIESRFETVLGNGGNAIINGYPTNEEADTVDAVLSDLVDEEWHVFRWHWKIGSGNGIDRMWIDGVLESDLTSINTGSTTSFYGVALGRNMNQGPDQTQQMKWGRIRIYDTNPGWT